MPETPRMNYFSLMNICTCTIYRLNYKQQTQIELCSKITDTHMKSMSQAKVLTLTVHYYKTQTLIDVFFLFVLLTKSLTHSLTHSIPRLWGRRGGPEDRSRRPPQGCSFGDRQQEVWESHLRLVLDVVRPALSLSPTSASSLNGVLHDVFREGVMPRDVTWPNKYIRPNQCTCITITSHIVQQHWSQYITKGQNYEMKCQYVIIWLMLTTFIVDHNDYYTCAQESRESML